MKVFNKIFLVVFIMSLPTFAHAEVTKGGNVACISYELYNEAQEARRRQDRAGWDYVLKNGCIEIRAGINVSVLGNIGDVSKARIYLDDDNTIVMWAHVSAFQKADEKNADKENANHDALNAAIANLEEANRKAEIYNNLQDQGRHEEAEAYMKELEEQCLRDKKAGLRHPGC